MSDVSTPDTFPRQYARTQRLSLGEPRNISVSPDGRRVVFLRSRGGSDSVTCLWSIDVESTEERLICDPSSLLADADDLSPAERARRERLREGAGGITSYTHDDALGRLVFVLGGLIHIAELESGAVIRVEGTGPAFDARPDPQGRKIAFVDGRALKSFEVPPMVDGDVFVADVRTVVEPEVGNSEVSWGSADFIAAEEMDRQRGFWWSPDGEHLAVCRVDESPVGIWYIADPAHPERDPLAVRYPAAGTANPTVTLSVMAADGSRRRDLTWDAAYEYLATVGWTSAQNLMLTLQSRDQRRAAICSVDIGNGAVTNDVLVVSDTWVDLVPGSPSRLANGEIVYVDHRDGLARLVVGDRCASPIDVNVRSIMETQHDTIVFTANELERPEMQSIWRWRQGEETPHCLTPLDGVHSGSVGGSTLVVRRASLTQERATVTVVTDHRRFEIRNDAETPLVSPRVSMQRVGRRRIPTVLVLPNQMAPGVRLPVLMDPYGGPHAQRVVDSRAAHCTSQWFAEQGFAVVVVDGRGTPGLGTDWERAVHGDLADVVLEDQVDALQALVDQGAPLDTTRVGIRGWSFGGYLAALAVLRRPDVFHAAVAGAPVTDWRLYDTHYTERYLGDPTVDDGPYRAGSLILDAARLTRPLLLIHGLADDNVVAAHTLQLSSALLAAGKPHEVLPLSGVSHMTPQAVVAENLLLHQLDFLRRSLGVQRERPST